MNCFKKGLGLMALLVLTAGCFEHNPVLPVHDEVLVYNLPYDLTYLRVVEGLQSVAGWDLDITLKESGLVRVRNLDYSGLDDADKRTVTFLVKRIESRKTSVELMPESQQTLGSGDLLKAVANELSQEVPK